MTDRVSSRADALRREFDAAFAVAPAAPPPAEDLLTLRAGDGRWAVRLRDLSGVHLAPPIVPVPASSPELAGLAALRGVLVPVFDLARLLGAPAASAPRWLLTLGDPRVGLAFDALGAPLRAGGALLASPGGGPSAGRRFSAGVVVLEGGSWPLLDLAAVHRELTRRARAPAREEVP